MPTKPLDRILRPMGPSRSSTSVTRHSPTTTFSFAPATDEFSYHPILTRHSNQAHSPQPFFGVQTVASSPLAFARAALTSATRSSIPHAPALFSVSRQQTTTTRPRQYAGTTPARLSCRPAHHLAARQPRRAHALSTSIAALSDSQSLRFVTRLFTLPHALTQPNDASPGAGIA